MPIIVLGPFEMRLFSGASGPNWTDLELAFVTSRTKAGFADRETSVRVGLKSDHLLDAIGEDNPDDAVTVNGTTYYGKVAAGFDGHDHRLTAQQVSTQAEYLKALQESRRLARVAAQIASANGPLLS